jgi:hypothetical protein
MNVTSPTTVTFTANVTFKPAFTGAKEVYLLAQEPLTNSGWVSRGVWTVP